MAGSDGPREAALRRLPVVYSLALRLQEAGVPEALIAECVDVEPEAVGALLVVGEAKLAAVLRKSGHQRNPSASAPGEHE